jgi:hypothetical protein
MLCIKMSEESDMANSLNIQRPKNTTFYKVDILPVVNLDLISF